MRYQELNDKGEVETVFHAIGTLYLRKTSFQRGAAIPQEITVTVEV